MRLAHGKSGSLKKRFNSSLGFLTYWLAGLALVLVFGGLLVGQGMEQFQIRADEHLREEVRIIGAEEGVRCRLPVWNAALDCLKKVQPSMRMRISERRREYDDLVAQQTSAHWTALMGFTALLGLLVSAGGILLVFRTFEETKRTADEAMRAADVAEASRQAYVEAERGLVVVLAATGGPTNIETWAEAGSTIDYNASITVKNLGPAMARSTEIIYWICDTPGRTSGAGQQWVAHEILKTDQSKEFVWTFPDLAVAVPLFISGFLRYRTLSLTDCRTHFHIRIDREEVDEARTILKNKLDIKPGHWISDYRDPEDT